jgi:hypothetical protein
MKVFEGEGNKRAKKRNQIKKEEAAFFRQPLLENTIYNQ